MRAEKETTENKRRSASPAMLEQYLAGIASDICEGRAEDENCKDQETAPAGVLPRYPQCFGRCSFSTGRYGRGLAAEADTA